MTSRIIRVELNKINKDIRNLVKRRNEAQDYLMKNYEKYEKEYFSDYALVLNKRSRLEEAIETAIDTKYKFLWRNSNVQRL